MKLRGELRREAAALLTERHRKLLRPDESLSVDGEALDDWTDVTLTVEAPARDERVEITVRVEREVAGEDEAAWLALDAADALLGEWLESGRASRLPDDLLEREFEGRRVHARMRRGRPRLEAEADRLLEEAESGSGEPGEGR